MSENKSKPQQGSSKQSVNPDIDARNIIEKNGPVSHAEFENYRHYVDKELFRNTERFSLLYNFMSKTAEHEAIDAAYRHASPGDGFVSRVQALQRLDGAVKHRNTEYRKCAKLIDEKLNSERLNRAGMKRTYNQSELRPVTQKEEKPSSAADSLNSTNDSIPSMNSTLKLEEAKKIEARIKKLKALLPVVADKKDSSSEDERDDGSEDDRRGHDISFGSA